MGFTLQNLDKITDLPIGSGEQNLVQFLPNIHALQYLEQTKQTIRDLRKAAIHRLKTGSFQ